MFIKKVKKSKQSVSVRIVENHRKSDGSVGQELIKIVGTGRTDGEIQILERAAREMILIFKSRVSNNNSVKSLNDIPDDIKLNTVKENKRVNDGVIDIIGPFYDQCGFDSIITGTYKDKQWNNILKALVLARIAFPASKRKTASILSREYLSEIPLEKVYRTMDKISPLENKAREIVLDQTKKFNKGKINIMLFDVTTLYFESIVNDELKSNGFSKDCKFKEVQVMLSLTTTDNGLPIDYTLFPGNTSEGNTLIETILKLKNQYQVDDITLIADRAMFSEKNLLEMDRQNIKYIVACKLKSLSAEFKKNILNDNDYVANLVEEDLYWAKSYLYKNRKIIVSYSSKRAQKDKHHREKLVERILKKARDGKVKISELITNNGTKKIIKCIKGNIEVDQEKINQDAKWDGIHGIITNDNNENIFKLLTMYRQLWKIEEAFRINKHDLKMRPIYHWKPNRIKAHILICYLAFSLSKYLIERLKIDNIKISIEELKKELLLVESSILTDISDKSKTFYLLPSPLTERQQMIYDAFGVERRITPWAHLS